MTEIINVVLIGKPKTGKTTFMNNIANDYIYIEPEQDNKSFNLRLYITKDRDKSPVEVRIWDISSKPRFYSVVSFPIKKADIILYMSNESFRVDDFIEYKVLIDKFIKDDCETYYIDNKKRKILIDNNCFLSKYKYTYEICVSDKKQCICLIDAILHNYLERLYRKREINKKDFLIKSKIIPTANNKTGINQPLLNNGKNDNNNENIGYLMYVWKKIRKILCINLDD